MIEATAPGVAMFGDTPMKKTLLVAGLAALVSAPLIAQGMGHEGHKMMAREPMTRSDVQTRVKTHFAEMDSNKDGSVTQAEIDAGRAAKKAERHDEMFTKMDTDKNGSISRAEFDTHHAGMMHSGHRGRGDHQAMKSGHGGRHGDMGRMGGRMFAMADANKDGKVTEAEATSAALARFDSVDTDRNGTISDAERQAAREKMRTEWKAKKSS